MPPTSLKRSISWVQGVALTVGAVVGISILVLPALTARTAGPAAVVSWLAMAALTFPVVVTLGTLATRFPSAGGLVAYAGAAFGDRAGAVLGWVLLGSIPIGVPIIALIGSHYLGVTLELPLGAVTALAFGMLGLSVALNVFGIRLAAGVQVAIVCVILVLVVLSVGAALPHVRAAEFEPFAPFGWPAVIAAIVPIFFSFVGFEMVAPLAEEFRDPRRDMMRALLAGAAVIAFLYVAVAFATVGAGAYREAGALAPFSLLVRKTFGPIGGQLTAFLAALVAFASIHINVTGFSRVLYAQARNGYLPARLADLHPRFHTPVVALMSLAAAFAVVLTVQWILQPDLVFLVQWPSVVFIFAYIATMAAGLRLLSPRELGWWTAWLALLLCLVVFSFSGWVTCFPLVLSALGWYATRRRRSPVDSVGGDERASRAARGPADA